MKKSKETRELILKSALELFLEKSYSKTSTEDIRKKAGNLSRGGLYYFFSKKEDILNALPEYIFKGHFPMEDIVKDNNMKTIDKIKKILFEEQKILSEDSSNSFFYKLMASPEFLSLFLSQLPENIIPLYYQLIVMGNEDGSMNVENPQYAAEILPLLLNIWLNPTFFYRSGQEDIKERIDYLDILLNSLGIPLIDENIKDIIEQTWNRVKPN